LLAARAAADDDGRPSSSSSPSPYFDAGALHRERLAFQQRRQQPQARGLSSFPPLDSSGSSTSSLDDAADTAASAAAAAAASPSSVRPPARHHKAQHYARLVRAWKRGRLGFGFSAGGLLFPYYAGTIAQLRDMGVLPADELPDDGDGAAPSAATNAAANNNAPASTTTTASPAISRQQQHRHRQRRPHLAGASAGALIAAVANAGVPLPIVEEACVQLAADCLAHGTPGRLGPGLRALLEKHLPPDAHLRCRGNTHVAVTKVVPVWRPEVVSDFESRADLIEALMASAHIPLYLDGRWATRFRGKLVIDGGATSFIPLPPLRSRRRRRAEGEGEEGAAFDPDATEHEEEEDDEDAEEEESNSGDGSEQEQGAVDAVVKVCCFPTWHLSSLSTAAASVETPLGINALSEALRTDVSPDAFEPFPYDLATVARWALAASPRETFDFLLARGRRDAALFARESGLEQAALEREGKRAAAAARAAGAPVPPPPQPLPLPPPPATPPVAAAVKDAASSLRF
jgi:hypothetical protein